jgi:hypothetical protein
VPSFLSCPCSSLLPLFFVRFHRIEFDALLSCTCSSSLPLLFCPFYRIEFGAIIPLLPLLFLASSLVVSGLPNVSHRFFKTTGESGSTNRRPVSSESVSGSSMARRMSLAKAIFQKLDPQKNGCARPHTSCLHPLYLTRNDRCVTVAPFVSHV